MEIQELIGGTATTPATTLERATSKSQLSRDEFYQIMIAELTNQDPFQPLDNKQFLEQIASLQSLDATTRLTDAIDRLLLGQALSSASGLIGKRVVALDEDGAQVPGVVDRVRVEGDSVKLVLGGGLEVELDRVVEVSSDA